LHIIEEYRGMGLANRLLIKAEEWTINQGLNSIALHVINRNKAARHIYEKQGYKLVATHNESCFYEKKV
jgi:ribosomal protein S18 acetylase RimI-like enzyme